jgi:hypothetical protein
LHDATFKVVAAELEAETDRQSFSKGGTKVIIAFKWQHSAMVSRLLESRSMAA